MLGRPSEKNSIAVGDYVHILSQFSSSAFDLDDIADLHGLITGFSITNTFYTISFTVKTEEVGDVVLQVPYHYASLSSEDFHTHVSRINSPHYVNDAAYYEMVERIFGHNGRVRKEARPHEVPAKRVRY
ncbi:hypothetical protein FPV67DRAFT_1656163 [Lyophyllum atratum]|nr:hypothetical protein FPV67DRAFT_1656163 [Lyophyllum atratum]